MRAVVVALVFAVLCLGTAMAQDMQLQVGTETHEEHSNTNVKTETELEVGETTTLEQTQAETTAGTAGTQIVKIIKEQVGEQNAGQQLKVTEKVRERLHKHAAKIEEGYAKAKQKYKILREKYMKLKQEGKLDFGHAKKYCFAAGIYIEKWFDRIETLILNSKMDNETKEAMLARIEEERAIFEEKLQAVNESETPEELREAVKELKEEWKNVRILVKAAVMQVVIVKIENVVEKAEDLQLKLEERINEVGSDELAAILEDYEAKLEDAKDKLEEAKDILTTAETREDVNEAQKLIRDAVSLLRDAFKDVREIVKGLREERKGKVFFGNQTGELFARGNGTAKFEGKGIVVVRGNGTLIVEPDTAIVTLVGFGSKSVENGVAKVSGEGRAVIRGENIKVTIEGESLRLFIKGSGSVYLEGEGSYKVKKLPKYKMTEEVYEGSVEVEIGGEQ